jgi:hypothetical protein
LNKQSQEMAFNNYRLTAAVDKEFVPNMKRDAAKEESIGVGGVFFFL